MAFYIASLEESDHFLSLLLVLLLAFLVPIALARFRRLPVVVGEIVAGILIGPTVLGWVGDDAILTFMADVGLAFLMFLAGMEINLSQIIPKRNGLPRGSDSNVAGKALRVYLITALLALLAGFLLNALGAGGDQLMLAFVFSATSLGVVLPTLKDRMLLGKPFGQFVLLGATLADFITIILLTVYVIVQDRGLDPGILSLGLLFLAFLILFRVGPGIMRRPTVRAFLDELSQATVQIKVRGAILLLIMFVVLAEFVDAELILGAFLAGLIVSLLKGPEDEGLAHRLEAFGFGFFIPVFFIMVGVNLDLRAAFETPGSLLLLPAMLVISLVVKLTPLLSVRGSFPRRELLAAGFLLNTHLSLEVAIAVVGLRTGLFDASTGTVVVLFAVATVITMPLIFNALLPAGSAQAARFIMAVGVTDLAIQVAQHLRLHGEDVRFAEQDPVLVARVQSAGFPVLPLPSGDGGLQAVDLSSVQSILALDENDAANLRVARRVRAVGDVHVVAYVQNPDHLVAFEDLNVQPFMSAVHGPATIAMMARNPGMYALLTAVDDDRKVVEVRLGNSQLANSRVRNLALPGDILVLSIRRNGELIVPRGNTVLEFGDRLALAGTPDALAPVLDWLEGRGSYDAIRRPTDVGLG